MELGTIIQARLDSDRLPGKVLRPIAGRPLLDYLIDRLRRVEATDNVVIATSSRSLDDPIAEFAVSRELQCYRGDADDVAGRMLAAAEWAGLDAFVRISGDSPLLDNELVDRAIGLFAPGIDLVTNTSPRTYPPGESVEVVRTSALASAHVLMTDPYEREHVTPYFYRHPEKFAITTFESGRSFGELHFAVDTEAHFQTVSDLIERMERPHWQYRLEELAQLA